MQGYFTFYTPEEIQEHMNKYMRELKLIEKKKECIVEYKNIKETRKMAELEILDLQRDECRELREKEERKRKGERQQA